MAGTDASHCSVCGEGWYDQADRVGTVCPNCYEIQRLEVAAAEAAQAAENAKQKLIDRRNQVHANDAATKAPKAKVGV